MRQRNGVAGLFKKNKAETFHGPGSSPLSARLRSRATRVRTRCKQKDCHCHRLRRGAPFRASRSTAKDGVVDRGARARKVPKHLVVVGAGVIGLELGSVWRRLGAQGDGGGIPRRRAARHGWRSAPPGAASVRETGHGIQAVVEGDGGRHVGEEVEATSSRPKAALPKRSRPTSFSSPSAACLTPTASG